MREIIMDIALTLIIMFGWLGLGWIGLRLVVWLRRRQASANSAVSGKPNFRTQ
jgi:hypothetical protein